MFNSFIFSSFVSIQVSEWSGFEDLQSKTPRDPPQVSIQVSEWSGFEVLMFNSFIFSSFVSIQVSEWSGFEDSYSL